MKLCTQHVQSGLSFVQTQRPTPIAARLSLDTCSVPLAQSLASSSCSRQGGWQSSLPNAPQQSPCRNRPHCEACRTHCRSSPSTRRCLEPNDAARLCCAERCCQRRPRRRQQDGHVHCSVQRVHWLLLNHLQRRAREMSSLRVARGAPWLVLRAPDEPVPLRVLRRRTSARW